MFKRTLVASLVFALVGCAGTSTDSSSSQGISSSKAEVSSSSLLASSSLASSITEASSSLSSISSASAPLSSQASNSSIALSDCATEVSQGEDLYSAKICSICHGAAGTNGVTSGGNGGMITPVSAAQLWGKSSTQKLLSTYITEDMGRKASGGCDEDCGNAIAAYLTSNTNDPWCPSHNTVSSSSSAPELPDAVRVPALIQSENYVNAFDTTPENKGSCGDANQAVDMQPKTSGVGTCDVNWTAAGEYLDYNITVAQAGGFDFYVSLASVAADKTVTVQVGVEEGGNTLNVGNAEAPAMGWTTFKSVKAGTKQLAKGQYTVRITVSTGGLNIDALDVRKMGVELPYIPTDAELENGYKTWTESCDTCHGAKGEGAQSYPAPLNLLAFSRSELIDVIYQTMPKALNGQDAKVLCDQTCAKNVADFMINGYQGVDDAAIFGCEENPIASMPNTPIRLLTTAQFSKLVERVYAPLNINAANMIEDGTFVDDNNANGFVTNTGVIAGKDNIESMITLAEKVGQQAGNNFSKLMGCGINQACVTNYIKQYGEQLYRKTLNNTQVAELMVLFNANKNAAGIGHVTAAMLLSGSTLYQFEKAVTERKRLQPREIAERLSFLIWGMPTDVELLNIAKSGALNTPEGLRMQALAMLDDPRAAEGLRQFYDDYLSIESDYSVVGNDSFQGGGTIPLGECTATAQCAAKYPGLGADDCKDSQTNGYCLCAGQVCAQIGGGESDSGADFSVTAKVISDDILRFTSYLTRETSGTFKDLMNSRVAFVDATMANIYGVQPGANAMAYLGGKKVTLPAAQRAGLLTRAGFVIKGSGKKVGLTSPTQRGESIRIHTLCQEPPAVPGDVPFPEIPDPKEKTWVEVLKEIHLKDNDPSTPNPCVACHTAIDPIGFAFENYTLNGQYINIYPNGLPIDAAGWLEPLLGEPRDFDGARFNNAIEFSNVLGGSDDAAACFAETWMSYALARTIVGSAPDSCAAETLKKDFKEANYSLSELLVAIVTNPSFSFRNAE